MKWMAVCCFALAAGPATAQEIPYMERMPVNQRIFLHTVMTAQLAATNAKNDMQRGGVRAQRERTICEKLPGLDAQDWVGKVYKVSSNSDGKGVLEIEIAPDIYVMTWNNAFSDVFDKTLIEPSTAAFAGASQMEKGQVAVFSGSFVPDGTGGGGCIREGSLSLNGKLMEPEFLFRFSAVGPLQ